MHAADLQVITARPTSFEKAEVGDSAVEIADAAAEDAGISSFVSEELSKSDRPDLATAG
jgi:electron transfer flavoprotein alpha subunit